MEDKIRLDFLSRINQVAEEMVQERFNLMETEFEESLPAVSYTHLDVYKRQGLMKIAK